MIPIAIGLDLVEVDRVARLLTGHGDRAWSRLLTLDERAYCRATAFPERHVAARLAAKEAAYKALAIEREIGYIGWHEVEVVRADHGRPGLVLHRRARDAATRLGVAATLVSVTHTDAHAAAVVALFK